MSYDHLFNRMNDILKTYGGKKDLTEKQVKEIRTALRKEMDGRIPNLQRNVLNRIQDSLPGYDRVPSSERIRRGNLSERAREEMLNYVESDFYDTLPSKSPLIRRADAATQRFVVDTLNLNLDDKSLGGVSYREMRTTEDPEVRKRFYIALFERVEEMLDREVYEVASLTDDEAVERFRRTKSFDGLLFEVESIFTNEGLDDIPKLQSLKTRMQQSQNAISMAHARVSMIANPLYQDLSLEKGFSYKAEALVEASGPFLKRKTPEEINRYNFFAEMGYIRGIGELARSEDLCKTIGRMGYRPEMQPGEATRDFLKRVGVSAILPDGRKVTGEPLVNMLDGIQPLLLELPAQEGIDSRLISIMPGRGVFDTRALNGAPDLYFNVGVRERFEDLSRQVVAADKRVNGGSKEFSVMMHSLTMLNRRFVHLKDDGENYQKIKDMLEELKENSAEYLKFKESQRGLKNGRLVGKNATEQQRIETAQQVQNFVKEKLDQLNILTEHPDFKKNMTVQESAKIIESASVVTKAEQPSPQMAALEKAAQRSARELARMGEMQQLDPAAKTDARLHMARMVINEVVHLQGECGGMMKLYAQSPTKFLKDYAGSKEFKDIVDDPMKFSRFVEQRGAKEMAQNIVDSLAAKLGRGKKSQEHKSKERQPQEQMNIKGPKI